MYKNYYSVYHIDFDDGFIRKFFERALLLKTKTADAASCTGGRNSEIGWIAELEVAGNSDPGSMRTAIHTDACRTKSGNSGANSGFI